MKVLKIVAGVLVALLLVVAVIAPLGPIPGFFIGGERVESFSEWPDTSDLHEIRLKAPGALPRVVIIWVVDVGGELHVIGDPSSGWTQRIGNGGPVEVRIGDNTYPATAERVSDNAKAVWEAYIAKYEADYPEIVASFPPLDEAASGAAIFRLTPG